MTVKQIFESKLINDSTNVYIRHPDMSVLAHGNRHDDDVLKYFLHTVESFVWQDNNVFFIDLK